MMCLTVLNTKTLERRDIMVQRLDLGIILEKDEEIDWQDSYRGLFWKYQKLERKYSKIPSWLIKLIGLL